MRFPSVASAVLFLAMSILPPATVARASSDPLPGANHLPVPIERTAQRVARDLNGQGYQVERGYPMLYTDSECDAYSYPVMQNCYGNNPASPYVVLVVKSWAEEFVDPATVNALGRTRQGYSATYRLDPREAIVVAAELPPPGRYMGLQSWVFTKEWLTPDTRWNESWYSLIAGRAPSLVGFLFSTVPGNASRIQSFSSLSNNINNVVIERKTGAAFGQTRYFVITPDKHMDETVRASLHLAGVPDEHIFTEPIPPGIGPIGLDATADDFVTLIRYAMPDDDHAGHAWWTNLPLSILRVRERSPDRPPEPFEPFVADERTAADESDYQDDLYDLIRRVCGRWGQSCDPQNDNNPDQLRRLIDLTIELGQFGPLCRAIGMNCLGDGQDASYFVAPGRAFEDPARPGSGWIYAVVGTLGTKTGNATYVGLSVNDLAKLKGALNISDIPLTSSAASYSSTVGNTDKLFVHYFARDCEAVASLTDGQCTTVTHDLVPERVAPLDDLSTEGLFSAALRSYVQQGKARGPLSSGQLRPWVIRFDQP